MEGIVYLEGEQELLDHVGPLWEKLNEIHRKNTKYFQQRYANLTFSARKEALLEKVAGSSLMRVELAKDVQRDVIIGYCICTVNRQRVGEVESIYIEEAYRGKGAGNRLMENAFQWMDSLGVKTKTMGVAVGNEGTYSFYSRYGFYPRITYLYEGADF